MTPSGETAASLAIRKARADRLREVGQVPEFRDDWYENRDNLARLYLWLEERGQGPDGWHFLTSPWRWDGEWLEMLRELRETGA